MQRFEAKGFHLKGLKLFQCSKELAETHYGDLSEKPFFADLVSYIISGPVCCMVWEGPGVVKSARKLIGCASPLFSSPSLSLQLSSGGLRCHGLRRHASHAADASSALPLPDNIQARASDGGAEWSMCSGRSSLAGLVGLNVRGGVVTACGCSATNPLESEPGTIRGDLAIEVGRNVIHGSDSVENGEKEIALWFKEGELVEWDQHMNPWLRE